MLKYIFFTLLCYSFAIPHGQAQGQIQLSVREYDEKTAHEEKEDPVWTIMDLRADNQTTYRLIEDEQKYPAIKAESINAAAGLIHSVDIDPEEYPIIEWSWKVDRVLENGDLRKKSGEDPPRITGVAIMTDTDNTGEKATGWYGDITFKKKAKYDESISIRLR